ncbi:MAG: hypothetical protein FD188_2837 [Ignavibacteria bacterium]|nr:MAG: hypothetical protein FD188_2837 [Ignavibacteria bacterium]
MYKVRQISLFIFRFQEKLIRFSGEAGLFSGVNSQGEASLCCPECGGRQPPESRACVKHISSKSMKIKNSEQTVMVYAYFLKNLANFP